MNMGNVMGNVTWMTKDFRSDGRLSIGSTGHKNLYIGVGLGGSSLDAKGGIVGGTIELSKIDTYSKLPIVTFFCNNINVLAVLHRLHHSCKCL